MRSRLLLAMGLGFATLACAELIGLDKIKKCEQEIECGAGDASDLDASDAGDASDAFIVPDGASEASSWPHWRMDNTPTEVQNGAADASLAKFSQSGNVIVDGVTTLTWKAQLGSASSLDDAVKFCNGVNGRLPTRIEAATLLDSTRKGAPYIAPAFDAIVMPDGAAPPPALWTSSYHRPVDSTLHFWFVRLDTGDMIQTIPAQGIGVLCVQ